MVDIGEEEELEQKIQDAVSEELDERTTQSNTVAVSSHDINVRLNSETESMERLVELANETMREREKQAIVGEYAVLEEQNMMGMILGGE